MRKLQLMLLLLAMLLRVPCAIAHAASTSYLEVDSRDSNGPLAIRWDLPVVDLAWTIDIDRDLDRTVRWGELQASQDAIQRLLRSGLLVQRGSAPCEVQFRELALARRADENHASVQFVAQCERPGALTIASTLFFSDDASQRVLLRVRLASASIDAVLSPATPRWREPDRPALWRTVVNFMREGVWHVLIGYDHVAFVLLLLLPAVLRQYAGRWQAAASSGAVIREVLVIVTAFTVAHSITLALAVTNTVRLPDKPVEVAIALSIVIAGIANLFPSLSKIRLPVAFLFGLVHGFGFANALGEIDTGGGAKMALLAGFNFGVEIAQLFIVAVILPLIFNVRASGWYATRVVPIASCALSALGFVWMVQRLG